MKVNITCLVLLSIMVLSTSCKNAISTYENSKHRIDLERSKELYKNYNDHIKPAVEFKQKERINRESVLNPNGDYNPTEYVLMNIDTLKCYIKFLEAVEKKNGQKITGIAVFLGANNSNELIKHKAPFNAIMKEEFINNNDGIDNMAANADVRGRMTNFLAPTYRDETRDYNTEVERHQPFYIQPSNATGDKYKGTYINLINYLKSNQDGVNGLILNQMPSNSNSNSGTSLNQNEFNQMPPKKPNGNP